MEKRYIAMLQEKHSIGQNTFIFSGIKPIIGNLDEKTYVLTDRNGNSYIPLEHTLLLEEPIPSYADFIELSELRKQIDPEQKLTLSEAVKDYEQRCKSRVYVISKEPDGSLVAGMMYLKNLKKFIAESNGIKTKDEEEKKTEFYHPYKGALNLSWITSNQHGMYPGIKRLLEDIEQGRFSLEELKMLRDDLKSYLEDLNQANSTISLQLEGLKNPSNIQERDLDLPFHYRDGMLDSIKQLLSLVFSGDLTIEEQKRISTRISDICEDLTQALYTIEMQIEETTKRESKNRLPGEIARPPFDVNKLYDQIKETVICQDVPLRRILVELSRKEMDPRKKKQGLLITGKTGVGKTEILRLIGEYTDRPFLKVDSLQLTSPGYVGEDIEQVLWRLYVKCGKDIHKAERAILAFDEIDKKGSERKSDVSGQGVLNVLLPFIEGSTYTASPDNKPNSPSVQISTHNMISTLQGAFEDVYEKIAAEGGMGFGNDVKLKGQTREATKMDFVKYGMMTKEIMGRVTVIKLNDLEAADLKRVLFESRDSELKVQENIFEQFGVKIHFTDEFVNIVAERAKESNDGVRGTQTIIDDLTHVAYDDVSNIHWGEYSEITFDEETTNDPTHYQKVYRLEPIKKSD